MGLLELLPVVGHAAANQWRRGNEGSECQIAVDSRSKEPFFFLICCQIPVCGRGGWQIVDQQGHPGYPGLGSGSRYLNTKMPFSPPPKEMCGLQPHEQLECLFFSKRCHVAQSSVAALRMKSMTDGISGGWHESPIWLSDPRTLWAPAKMAAVPRILAAETNPICFTYHSIYLKGRVCGGKKQKINK